MIRATSEKTAIVYDFVKNRKRIVFLGVFAEICIFDFLYQSRLFTRTFFYRIAADYLYKAMDKIAEKNLLTIFRLIFLALHKERGLAMSHL